MKINNQIINRIIFVLALAGIVVSGYLLYTYVADTPIVCANTGCETVRESPYSYFLGVPLPAFGLLFFVFVLVLSFLRTFIDKVNYVYLATRVIFVASLVGFLTSVYLTYLEAFVIKAYCTWCVVSAIIVTLIFILSILEIRRLK